MEKEFSPTINRKVFKETIFRIQNNEGNNSNVVNTIAEKIENTRDIYFFDTFINVCKGYNIEYDYSEEIENNKTNYRIIINVNGHEYFSMSYSDKNNDVSENLACKLYDAIGIQIRNQEFIKSVEK